jgi:hypothetical protein
MACTLLVSGMLLLLLLPMLNGAVGTGMVGTSDGTGDVFVRGALPRLCLTEDDVASFFAYCSTFAFRLFSVGGMFAVV